MVDDLWLNAPVPLRRHLVRSLFRDGLADELRIFIYSVVVGSGKRLCEGDDEKIPLNLTHASLDVGVNYVVTTSAWTDASASRPLG